MTLSEIPIKNNRTGEVVALKVYLRNLILTLWREGHQFNGKRPFGDSGWKWDIYTAMIEHKFLKGKLDEDGYIDDVDEVSASAIIENLIQEVFE